MSKQSQVSILLVDDDPHARALLAMIIGLKYGSERVYTADDGRHGLKVFRETNPEIVLTDIRMPVMDGISMARDIRNLSTEVCIIAITAISNPDLTDEEKSFLFDAYLVKPVDSRGLCSIIDTHLACSPGQPSA